MPRLKQLSCCIQWKDTNAPFQEYGTHYGDGVVETFIVVPMKPQGFCIRLTSHGFIHEGLAMVVFIDGNYQCNRSRMNLLPKKKGRPLHRTEIDFLLRQKEKPHGDGIYMGREWRFDNHNIVSEAPQGFQESHFDDLGTIEVLVLRCRTGEIEDTEYDGPSSGEDSDFMAERSAVAEEKEEEEPPPAAVVTQAPSAEPLVEVEDTFCGMMGFFDGTNDPPNLHGSTGGYIQQSNGQWVWHQRQKPQELSSGHFRSGHLADTLSCTTSHGPPNVYPSHRYQLTQPHPYSTRTAPKQVRFDFGGQGPAPGPRPDGPQSHGYQYPSRPLSRERMRVHDQGSYDASQQHLAGPYAPQRVEPLQQSSISSKYHDNIPASYPQTSEVQTESQPRHHLSTDDINGAPTSHPRQSNKGRLPVNDIRGEYQLPPEYHSQNSQAGQSVHGQAHMGQHYHNAQPPPPEVRVQQTYPYPYAQEPLPNLNQPMTMMPHIQNYTPEHQKPPMIAIRPVHYFPQPPSQPAVPIPFFPSPPGYGHQSNCPYPQWPHHYQGPYAYPEPEKIQSTQPEDGISPKTTTANGALIRDYGQVTSASSTNDLPQPQPQGTVEGECWVNQDLNAAENKSAITNGTWDASGNQTANNTGNEWGVCDQNTNADDNDDKKGGNDDWNASNNVVGVGDDWDTAVPNKNKDTATDWGGANDNNNIDTAAAWANTGDNINNNEDGAGDWGGNESTTKNTAKVNGILVDNIQRTPSQVDATANTVRDLYGPHGITYSVRALRLGEPQPDAEEEPRFDVPKSLAIARGSTKQVQPGPGYRYVKKRVSPTYIDSMEEPYARFVFKYRTKEQLANEIGISVSVEPTGDQEIQDLQSMDKQILIEMLMRAKSALGGKVPSPPASPLIPGTESDMSLPVAVDAPRLPFLKYTLPPLRPSNFSGHGTSSDSAAASSNSLASRDNNGSAGNSNGDSWTRTAPKSFDEWNANSVEQPLDNGKGTAADNRVVSAASQSGQASMNQSRQNSQTHDSRQNAYGGTWDLPVTTPPRLAAPPSSGNEFEKRGNDGWAAGADTGAAATASGTGEVW